MKTATLMAELALLEKVNEALDTLRAAEVMDLDEVRQIIKRFMDSRPEFRAAMQTALGKKSHTTSQPK